MNVLNMRNNTNQSTSTNYKLYFGYYGEIMEYTKGSHTLVIVDSDGNRVELLVRDIEYIKKSLDKILEINGK